MLLEQVKDVRSRKEGLFLKGCPNCPASLTMRHAENLAPQGSGKGTKANLTIKKLGRAM